MTEKVIWIINQYASTPETGMGGRHYYLSKELAERGYKVYLIGGGYSHILRNPKVFDQEFLLESVSPNFNFIWVKLDKYDNAHSKKRIINEFVFAFKLRKLVGFIKDKPDIIIHSSPALTAHLGVKYLSDYYNAPFCFEVRDPWPLTLIEIGGYSKFHPFILFLQWLEDRSFKYAKYIFSNFFNGLELIASRNGDTAKFHWLPNGIYLPEISNNNDLDREIASLIPKDKFIIGYTGTLGEANAMTYFIEAAAQLKEYDNIFFVVVGNGKEKEHLKHLSSTKGINNICFIDAIPKTQIQSMLQLFDVCYIGWHNNPMYRLGIAANKLPEYLYSGKPVLHSYSGSGDIIKQANAGLTVEAENVEQIASAIKRLSEMDKDELSKLGENGRKFVLDNLDYSKIASKLEKICFE